jgi:hypothetical protein
MIWEVCLASVTCSLVHQILGRADWITDCEHEMENLTKGHFNYPYGHYCSQNTLMG